jgi:hypothetical protein
MGLWHGFRKPSWPGTELPIRKVAAGFDMELVARCEVALREGREWVLNDDGRKIVCAHYLFDEQKALVKSKF